MRAPKVTDATNFHFLTCARRRLSKANSTPPGVAVPRKTAKQRNKSRQGEVTSSSLNRKTGLVITSELCDHILVHGFCCCNIGFAACEIAHLCPSKTSSI